MMSWLFRSLILVVTAASLVTTVHSTLTLEASKSLSGHLANLQFHNNILYIGGTNKIYALNIDLSVNASTSTCDASVPKCGNVNKILMIDQYAGTCGTDMGGRCEKLVSCGTSNGQCEIRALDNISHVDVHVGSLVSNNTDRPAQGMITINGKFMVAVTFGSGIEAEIQNGGVTYSYPISTRNASSLQLISDINDSAKGLQLAIPIPTDTQKTNLVLQLALEDYVIYYKSKFQHNGYSYFVTNQKQYVGEATYVSKLVRICQNDTVQSYSSYTDIPLACEINGTKYNLIQDAVIIETPVESSNTLKWLFVGTFTNGSNPENLTGDSVICTQTLLQLDNSIMEARKNNSVGGCSVKSSKERYLLDPNPDRSCINDTDYREVDFLCTTLLPKYTNVISDTIIDLTPRYTLGSAHGYMTTLHGTTLENGRVVIMAGTSNGQLVRMNVNEADALEEYDRTDVHAGSIQDIHQESDDFVYVMSENKISRYSSTDCSSEYTTCADTMHARNPLCGWCVYQGRATRKDHCPTDGWLSSHEECVSLTLAPNGVEIDQQLNVTITANNLPVKRNGDVYTCRYISGEAVLSEQLATRSNITFQCSTGSRGVHTPATLELMVNGTVILGKASFLFYSCGQFKKCVECVGTPGSKCLWHIGDTTCSMHSDSAINEEMHCPMLNDNSGSIFIPTSTSTVVAIKGTNIDKYANNGSTFWCFVRGGGLDNKDVNAQAEISEETDTLKCNLTLYADSSNKTELDIGIKYGRNDTFSNDLSEVDDDFKNKVIVYTCEKLATDCSHCTALNKTRYACHWYEMGCVHSASGTVDPCPQPILLTILPRDGSVEGGTKVTITGSELGSDISEVSEIKLADTDCSLNSTTDAEFGVFPNEDYERKVPSRIVCITGGKHTGPVTVTVTVNGSISSGNISFSYKQPRITAISPTSGPKAGGTTVTLTGQHLGIGNRKVIVFIQSKMCEDARVDPNFSLNTDVSRVNFTIVCELGAYVPTDISGTILYMDEKTVDTNRNLSFKFLPNPEIMNIKPMSGILSGGTKITIEGEHLSSANKVIMEGGYNGSKLKSIPCDIQSSKRTVCSAPPAPQNLRDEMARLNKDSSGRRKRSSTCVGCIEVQITIYLDGYKVPFNITYFRDPSIDTFGNGEDVLLFNTKDQELRINGNYLNLVAEESDVNITIGVDKCSILELKENYLTCLAPKEQPQTGRANLVNPEVNVTIGNIHTKVGYLHYEKTLDMLVILTGSLAGGLVALVIIGVIIGSYKYRKVGRKAKDLEQSLIDMEMEIRGVARQEFLDMHTTMSGVNKNLVERGFPYHDYQQYACNVMFSVDYLWAEPVMTDVERQKTNKGMESLESLIINKFFLVSVISTMEKQKRFFIREKANLAGNLCAILMGKMDYLNEILKLLVTNLVQESTAKKRKTLFRRCESITEKLLSNWLSLTLYPHIKVHSGSPLYLLYVATQKTMESGPIDAVTEDAKYTLSEEKLLKNWCSASTEDGTQDLKFEAKTLTLNVIVDNGEEIYRCKTLDCDTITQVKSKCLTQIYVNYPASRLNVQPNELALEWHEGFGGFLKLQDVDNTTKQEGHSVRLNTLAHYNVKDETNMALIDPQHIADIPQQEDYVNLAQVQMDMGCNGSMDSTEPLAPQDKEKHEELQHWHLVKKEEDTSKQGKSAIAELYFNRLFTTKQSLLVYMRSLFDIILDKDNCPPPTKFLYDFLDELGDKNKVESNTVHAWKSHSYAIRVWASLMKMPNLLFDVNIPSYVASNLEIISQVFIESFSLSSQKFTKDSPSQKLIFHHEMNDYRDRVKEFYKNVNVNSQNSEEQRHYMSDVNKLQQQTKFNKISALYRFYQQLNPYLDEILEDLAMSKETSSLQLDKKLEQVRAIMEEDDD